MFYLAEGRVKNASKNFIFGVAAQIFSLLLNFIVRTIFIKTLSIEYLGVDGLFSNILTVLSLAELGFGTAMVYSMYKPLAEHNKEKLKSLMKLYSNVYCYIGITVGVLGVCLIPFLDYIIKEKPNISYLTLIYIMVLLNTVVSYFFSYKRSILNADQKSYISSNYRCIFLLLKAALQSLVLVVWRNFYIYLLIQIICTLLENIMVSIKVNKIYPFLKERGIQKLEKKEINRIVKDVKALIIYRISHVALNGTDNIIISAFLGIADVGLVANYNLIINSVTGIFYQIPNALQAGIGNFVVKENRENQYKIFKNIDFAYFVIFSFASVCLCILITPFINLWVGEGYSLNNTVVYVLCLNVFIEGTINIFWTFRSSMGLFEQGKYRPIFTMIINILASIILAKWIGVVGVFLGTTISRVSTNLWYDAYTIYKYGLKKNVSEYYKIFSKRIILLVGIIVVLKAISFMIFKTRINVMKFIIMIIITVLIFTISVISIYHKTDEYKYLKNIIMERIKNGL